MIENFKFKQKTQFLFLQTMMGLSMLTAQHAIAADQTTIYVNGQVFTNLGWKTAFAESNGDIVSIGTDDEIKSKFKKDTNVVDLKGKTVFPGLADLHIHPIYAAKFFNSCDVKIDANAQSVAKTVAECVKKVQPGDYIYGSGWNKANPHVQTFNKTILDQVAPNNPVVLADTSGHDVWANSLALKAAGFTKSSSEMPGGKIERDAYGEPTGILREAPAAKLRYAMPPANDEEATRLLKSALDVMLSKGITTFVDAGIRLHDVKAYNKLADKQQLHQHVRGCIIWNKESPDFDTIYANRIQWSRPNFHLDCVKVFMDGTPNESHSAAMLHPYEIHDHEKPNFGPLDVQPEILNEKVTAWDNAGLIVKFHSGGDRAVKIALDAIEKARDKNGKNGPRHEISHVVFISKADMNRAKKLNVALEFSPVFWYPNPVSDGIVKATGTLRSKHIWPVQTAIHNQNFVISGSDWPGANDPNPWLAIETLVTRKAPGNIGPALAQSEAISLKQAIDLYTVNAAKVTPEKSDTGYISIGSKADFIILNRNPFNVSLGEIHKIKVLQTVMNGRTTFKSLDK